MHTIKQIIENNTAQFSFYQEGKVYYSISVENDMYEFPIPIEEVGTGVLLRDEKAIYFMKWIKKAIETETMRYTSRF